MSDSVRPHRRQPTRLPRPWDSLGKNTGVGCHFLLQCMKVKSQSEVAQSCPTLSDPMDCSLPGSSVHGIFQARVLEWGAIASSNHLMNACYISDGLPWWLSGKKIFACQCRRPGFDSHVGIQALLFTICGYLFYCLEKAMAPHSSTLAWRIPWMEEPGRLQSMGSQRVGND